MKISITRGVLFRDYDYVLSGGAFAEVLVSEGVIVPGQLPDELKTADEARSWAALLLAAADELELSK